MTGIALLARQQGYKVTGSDNNSYPPMSEILAAQAIQCLNGYDELPDADLYIVGNVMTRGMPIIEQLLNEDRPYISAPQWLAENVLKGRRVLAVAGTHGKTTTTALLTKLLIMDGREPGYLIAGAGRDFALPADLGKGDEFVLEADEYDSAFFDKRAKFIHYRPNCLILTSLEYDHADIYENLAAVEKQFCHLLRTVPAKGDVFFISANSSLEKVIDMDCLATKHRLVMLNKGEASSGYSQGEILCSRDLMEEGREKITIHLPDSNLEISWQLKGRHNATNLLAAAATAYAIGVSPANIKLAAAEFSGVARRLQTLGVFNGIEVISDFAHHPTSIKATITTLAEYKRKGKLRAIVDLASHSMRMGTHGDLIEAANQADEVLWFLSNPAKSVSAIRQLKGRDSQLFNQAKDLVDYLGDKAKEGDTLVLMSNGAAHRVLTPLIARLQG